MTHFPNEVLHMVCTELWHQRDFGTLFNCACAGRQLAAIAVTTLYRMQHKADSSVDRKLMNRSWMRLAGLWQAILLSILGKTLYPYFQYIRSLDLDILEQVLGRPNLRKVLFQGELQPFMAKTISELGDVITKRTPLLEELMANVPITEISRWVPNLPRLTHLRPWFGDSIGDFANIIRLHCPSFKSLSLSKGVMSASDQVLAGFLNEISPQSLQSFKSPTYFRFEQNFFQALNCHGESLKYLELRLPSRCVPKLFLSSGCVNLVSLSLTGDNAHRPDLSGYNKSKAWSPALQRSYDNAIHETVAWLKQCKRLKFLSITRFYFAPSLMAPMLSENDICLTSLTCQGFKNRDDKSFVQAIANQTSLKKLWLGQYLRKDIDGIAIEEDTSLDDALIESLSKLVNLTDLHLGYESDSLVDRHFVQLAHCLPKLVIWSTSGCRLTDAIWSEVATLKSLRKLDFSACMNFTAVGILEYIDKLGPGNKGLALSMTLAGIFRAELESIGKKIDTKVQGSFELTGLSAEFLILEQMSKSEGERLNGKGGGTESLSRTVAQNVLRYENEDMMATFKVSSSTSGFYYAPLNSTFTPNLSSTSHSAFI